MSYLQTALERDSLSYQAALYLVGKKALDRAPTNTRYEILRALYESNGLYDSMGKALFDEGIWLPELKPLGNPTNQVVSFYVDTLLAGELEIEAENDRLAEPIERFWGWSNLEAQKPVLTLENAMLGDSFLKVRGRAGPNGKADRVYFELIDPCHVYAFDTDERGYVTWIRIEVPQTRRLESGKTEAYTHVEVWSKQEQSYRRWEYREEESRLHTVDDDLGRLGPPTEEVPLSQIGINFVPIVHIPFRRVPGEQRGQAAVWPSIDKIVNLDLILTSLHSNYFAYDRPTWALESAGRDRENRPVPPPEIDGASTTNSQSTTGTGRTVIMGRDRLYRLPAGWTLRSTVPDVNFEAGLKIVQDYQLMLERERPELVYSRISELGGNLSGRAIKFMLTKALKMAEQARGNLEQGLVRADQMALTLMQTAGLVGKEIGSFDNPDAAQNFEHRFKPRPILPIDAQEDATVEQALAMAFKTMREAGLPMTEALQRLGYTEERAAELAELTAGELEQEAVTEQ